MYRKFIKGLLDFIVGLIIFAILSPVYILLTIFLFISFKGNPFFVQNRVGLNEKIFKIIKFKTMNNEKDQMGNLLPDSLRLTAVGKFVRKSSLDEIPQLINVLIGDMSIIGPRPLLPEYLPLYNKFQKKRHNLKPGITGWAQVNGRNELSWQEKFKYDVWYIENVSFILDFRIFLRTFAKVFKSDGISSENQVTMPKFTGND